MKMQTVLACFDRPQRLMYSVLKTPSHSQFRQTVDTNEQGGAYLRLRQEKRTIGIEIASVLVSLREFGATLKANAAKIEKSPNMWQPDADWFCADLRSAAANADRYRELQAQDARVQVDIDRYESAGL